MPEGVKIDISPFLQIISLDMEMYSLLFRKVNSLKWMTQYGKEESISELNIIRGMLGLKIVVPENESEFSRCVGECGKKILDETKIIRREATDVLKSITKEEITFGEGKNKLKEIGDI